jgi:hypothetical protein
MSNRRWLRLLRRERHAHEGPPHHHDPKSIPLHALPPARRCLCLDMPLPAAGGAIPCLSLPASPQPTALSLPLS